MNSKAGTVLLSQIKPDDEKFRISTRDDLDSLVASIQVCGLLNPPLLAPAGANTYIIVCGFRRIAACRRLGWERVEARFVSPGTSPADCAVTAIADNCSQRELNLIEMSRAVKLLAETLPDGADVLQFAGKAGLSVAGPMLSKIRTLCSLPLKLQQGLIDATLSLPMADRLHRMAAEDALEAYGLFCEIRAGLNVQREILDNAEESAFRDGLKVVDILRSEKLMEIRTAEDLDRVRKTSLVRQLLKERRYPALTEAEELFEKRVGVLGLPREMKLIPPAGFEGQEYGLALKFSNIEQLRKQNKTLERILNGDVLKKILD